MTGKDLSNLQNLQAMLARLATDIKHDLISQAKHQVLVLNSHSNLLHTISHWKNEQRLMNI